MGIREDIRNALGAIVVAVPESTVVMRHGEYERGTVVQVSSRDFTGSVSETGPAEAARYVVNAGEFPTLEEGSAVELADTLRVVVSMKIDPVGATYTVGLSAEFDKCPATYTGTRREEGSVRKIALPLDVLLLEDGNANIHADAYAPSYATAYIVAVRLADWPEVSAPEMADTIEVAPGGHPVLLKVSTVTRHDGWYVLKCRTKG
jgi:hypothetical protein